MKLKKNPVLKIISNKTNNKNKHGPNLKKKQIEGLL
jgi:hypothetical protein